MSGFKQKNHLILIGMMGTGKSTIGELLAAQLQMPLLDTDQLVEQKVKMSIADFFAQYGEEAFRQEESALLHKCVMDSASVITTGGGIVLQDQNRSLMKSYGHVICLSARPEVLVHRLRNDQTRPLLKSQENLRKRIDQLIQERKSKYQFADKHIDTSDRDMNEIVAELFHYWNSIVV